MIPVGMPHTSSAVAPERRARRICAERSVAPAGSVIRVTTDPGETFLDRMIALVEGAKRQRTPNEIALAILLAGLSFIFLLATVTLRPFGSYAGSTVATVSLRFSF